MPPDKLDTEVCEELADEILPPPESACQLPDPMDGVFAESVTFGPQII